MKALLIIDIQNDYFPGGRAVLVNVDAALVNAEKLLHEFRKNNLPIIHVQHINNRDGATFFMPDTVVAQIHECLTPREGEHVIVTHFPNSIYQTDLQKVIQSGSISDFIDCGMMTKM